tara:strand:+ start:390 stop:638 length:249 start_codon:yes stop_codon:yes gene_type:complete
VFVLDTLPELLGASLGKVELFAAATRACGERTSGRDIGVWPILGVSQLLAVVEVGGAPVVRLGTPPVEEWLAIASAATRRTV